MNITRKRLLHVNDSKLFEPIPEGLGCGDKHSVVNSARHSAKFITVNNSCMGATCITRRHVEYASTWRAIDN